MNEDKSETKILAKETLHKSHSSTIIQRANELVDFEDLKKWENILNKLRNSDSINSVMTKENQLNSETKKMASEDSNISSENEEIDKLLNNMRKEAAYESGDDKVFDNQVNNLDVSNEKTISVDPTQTSTQLHEACNDDYELTKNKNEEIENVLNNMQNEAAYESEDDNILENKVNNLDASYEKIISVDPTQTSTQLHEVCNDNYELTKHKIEELSNLKDAKTESTQKNFNRQNTSITPEEKNIEGEDFNKSSAKSDSSLLEIINKAEEEILANSMLNSPYTNSKAYDENNFQEISIVQEICKPTSFKVTELVDHEYSEEIMILDEDCVSVNNRSQANILEEEIIEHISSTKPNEYILNDCQITEEVKTSKKKIFPIHSNVQTSKLDEMQKLPSDEKASAVKLQYLRKSEEEEDEEEEKTYLRLKNEFSCFDKKPRINRAAKLCPVAKAKRAVLQNTPELPPWPKTVKYEESQDSRSEELLDMYEYETIPHSKTRKCQICSCQIPSLSWNSHINGTKHQKNLKVIEESKILIKPKRRNHSRSSERESRYENDKVIHKRWCKKHQKHLKRRESSAYKSKNSDVYNTSEEERNRKCFDKMHYSHYPKKQKLLDADIGRQHSFSRHGRKRYADEFDSSSHQQSFEGQRYASVSYRSSSPANSPSKTERELRIEALVSAANELPPIILAQLAMTKLESTDLKREELKSWEVIGKKIMTRVNKMNQCHITSFVSFM